MNNRRCPKRVPVVKIKPHETQEKTLENKPLKEIQNAPENPLLGVTTSEPLIRTINFEFNKNRNSRKQTILHDSQKKHLKMRNTLELDVMNLESQVFLGSYISRQETKFINV